MKTEMHAKGITRRHFIKGMAIGGAVLYAPEMLGTSEAQANNTPESFISKLQMIDAHAHPDRLTSNPDPTSTLQKIKELGMTASIFAAIGDAVFLSHGTLPTTEYYYTINQLDYWLVGLAEPNEITVVLKSRDIPKTLESGRAPGAILAIEGGDALEGKVRRVNEFYGLGVRLITVVHYRNNEIGDIMFTSPGTDPGPKNGGLTDTGRAVIERMRDLGMVVDVAHADHNTLVQIAQMNTGALLDSHTSLCPGTDPAGCGRLRTWEEMELIAETGGVVCTWPLATAAGTRRTFSDWADELLEMKRRLGINHVGIGTDGGGRLPALIDGYNDIKDLIQLIAAMENIGFSRNEIAAIMGGNFNRVLKRCIG